MKISNVPKTLTFDDVQIVPSFSDVISRSHCTTETQFTENYKLSIPIVASPMASVCEEEMAIAMWELGGVGVIHRFNTVKEQVQMVREVREHIDDELSINYYYTNEGPPLRRSQPVIAAAIGAKRDDIDRAAQLLEAGANVLFIDVAHGYHTSVNFILQTLNDTLRKEFEFDVVGGNIATSEAAEILEQWGVNCHRVGIGGGSVCETRIRTGIGIPQISSLQDVASIATRPIISCGGARYPGDIAKAIVAGANTVILGSMLSGTDESPGEIYHFGSYGNRSKKKLFHGSASDIQKTLNGSEMNNIEGTATMVDYKGSVYSVVNEIMDGVRSSMSYVGAHNLDEFYTNSEFVQVTHSGFVEGTPHLL